MSLLQFISPNNHETVVCNNQMFNIKAMPASAKCKGVHDLMNRLVDFFVFTIEKPT